MKTAKAKVRTSVKAGGGGWNHNKAKVRTGMRAGVGGTYWNHNKAKSRLLSKPRAPIIHNKVRAQLSLDSIASAPESRRP